ncbi:MAG: DUF4331 domain-containing protein [Caldilinea sp. CFX5]|nr:DUF4331 domain-containing protein [Caldilinea sp. CFX5]
MNTKPRKHLLTRLGLVLAVLLTPLLLTTTSLVVDQDSVNASSHREAPLISQDAYADGTDTYVFVSPANPDNLVLVGSWIPFEGPEGGPNYFEWGNGVLYSIHVDNNGDAKADYTYTLSSKVEVKNPLTFLYNTGSIGNDGANWNRQQRITITETSAGGDKVLVNNKLTAPVNIGNKSTPNFADLEKSFTYNVTDGSDTIKIYAGQVDDAFWVDLQVFDLLTLRGQQPPIGYSSGNNDPVDSVAGFNNHSMVIEVPISRLTQGSETVLGVWATASRPATRVLKGVAGLGTLENSGDAIQVSRLGMPLVNEVVIPLALKDAFNSIDPSLDLPIYTDALGEDVGALLQRSVEDPEIGRLLCALYGVPLPGDADDNCSTEVDVETPRSGRGDIFDIFLTGMKLAAPFTIQTKSGPVTLPAGFNVNQPANVVPAEVIRINTAIKGDLCSPTPSRLGVLGGDACGFPNGRRLFDDIVEIELLAVAGAAYPVLDGRDTSFSFNPALIGVLDDGIDFNDRPFRSEFPYMALAQSGQEHIHDNPTGQAAVESTTALIKAGRDDAEESKRGSVYFTSRDLDLGEDRQTIGLRFAEVNVPAGATIQKAHIAFVAKQSDNKATTLKFVAEAVDNAAAFTDAHGNISSRAATSANVAWNNVPEWKKNEKYWTPDLSAVIQEIVNRGGWSANNALNIIVTGTGEREAWAYDGSVSLAPVLYIEYSTSATAAAAGSSMAAGTSVLSSSLWRSEVDPATVVEPEGVDEDEVIDAQEAGSGSNTTDTTQASKAYLPIVTD